MRFFAQVKFLKLTHDSACHLHNFRLIKRIESLLHVIYMIPRVSLLEQRGSLFYILDVEELSVEEISSEPNNGIHFYFNMFRSWFIYMYIIASGN